MLDQLPQEITHMIADWTGHVSKESLQALCLVNREWNGIAKKFLSNHIVIRLREGKIPIIPDDRRILTQARQLSLVAEWTPRSHLETFRSKRIAHGTSARLERQYSGIPRALEGLFLEDRNVPKAGFYAGGDWSPIIDLIQRINYLHDVNIFVFYGGPVELHEALSQYHPTCRVSFFSTLMHQHPLQVPEFFPILQPVWLSSPMLHAVHLTCLEDQDRSPLILHPDKVLQNIVLHAPRLKKVALRIDPRHRGHTLRLRAQLDGVKVDKEAKSDKPPGPARIETMSWSFRAEMTVEQFHDWQTITDFSVLTSLAMGCIRSTTLLQSMTDDHPFQQLKRLTLALLPQEENGPRFWQAADSMFRSLPPLTNLCLLGSYTPEFANNLIRYKHGRTLLELALHGEIGTQSDFGDIPILVYILCKKGQAGPVFSTEHVRELANSCPSLQKLQICVQRCPGVQRDMSSALGGFPSLKKLYLVFNCLPEIDVNMMPVPLRELTDFEKGLASDFKWGSDVCPRWFIRDYILNCLMSESLVKEFFTQICSSQGSLVQLVITPLCGSWATYSKLAQYSCFPHGVMKFIQYSFFEKLASVWTIKQDNDTELHAIRKEPFDPPFLNENYPNEILSIIRSTGIWKARPDVPT